MADVQAEEVSIVWADEAAYDFVLRRNADGNCALVHAGTGPWSIKDGDASFARPEETAVDTEAVVQEAGNFSRSIDAGWR